MAFTEKNIRSGGRLLRPDGRRGGQKKKQDSGRPDDFRKAPCP
jgi:hypothetical protein